MRLLAAIGRALWLLTVALFAWVAVTTFLRLWAQRYAS